MKVLIDDKEIKKDFSDSNRFEIINEVRSNLDDSIIDKVFLDDKEVNLQYFQNQELELGEVDTIKFVTKKTDKLIEETLLEARDYLPKLKEGVQEISRLLKRQERELAGNKLLMALEGFEWYSGVLNNIKSLIDEEELKEQIEEKREKFNEVIQKALKMQQKDKQDQLADILSGEISQMVDDFINLNESLISRG